MEFTGLTKERFGKRAQAVSSALELHYRAEMAEALLSEKPAPRSPVPKEWLEARKLKKTPPSVVEVMLDKVGDLSTSQRKKAAEQLMTVDFKTRKLLSKSDRALLEKLVEPNSDTPMLKRSKVDKRIVDLLMPPKKFKAGDVGHVWKWTQDILLEFDPDAPRYFDDISTEDDGRPDDAEPDNPPDQDEPSTPTPGTPNPVPTSVSPGYEGLQLHIERVRCLRETRGEAGADEINAGGVAVDGPLYLSSNPSDASGEQFGPHDLLNFRTGEQRIYAPTMQLHEWDLTDKSLPHLFLAWFTLAEIDPAEGFPDYLDELETSIMAELAAYDWGILALAVYYGLSSAVSLALTISLILTGPIGWVILGIAATLGSIAMVILLLTVGNKDDIFELRELFMPLMPETLSGDPFHGNARSTIQQIIIEGDGGRYQIDYFWQLVGQIPTFTVNDQDWAFASS